MHVSKGLLHVGIIASLILFLALPTSAIPLAGDYTFNSTIITGTFTSDGSKVTDWNLLGLDFSEFAGVNSRPLGRYTTLINDEYQFIHALGTRFRIIRISWDQTSLNDLSFEAENGLGTRVAGVGSAVLVSAVPEPTSVLLFASGLLGLAGYRWHNRRGEGTQLG